MLGNRFARFKRDALGQQRAPDAPGAPRVPLGVTLEAEPVGTLFPPAEGRIKAQRDRLELVQRRVLRHEHFSAAGGGAAGRGRLRPLGRGAAAWPDSAASQDGAKVHSNVRKLTPIATLRGCTPGTFLVLGVLTTMADGRLYLEDLDAQIELVVDAESRVVSRGFFPEGAAVLVQGRYTLDRTLVVERIQQPPIEPAAVSLRYGAGPAAGELAALEQQLPDAALVILSDVWLDQAPVLAKLRVLFEGFSRAGVAAPLAFLLLGSFGSSPYVYAAHEAQRYREGWDALADVLAEFPALVAASRFVFVPGPGDPTLSGGGGGSGGGAAAPGSNATARERAAGDAGRPKAAAAAFVPGESPAAPLPQARIPQTLVGARIRRVLGDRAVWATDPCCVRVGPRRIFVFREDLVGRMRRSSLFVPLSDEADERVHLHHTLLAQAHACPLPPAIAPVFWARDAALRLAPLPDVLLLADRLEAYSMEHTDVLLLNPGAFPLTDYTFLVYYPSHQRVELSHISSGGSISGGGDSGAVPLAVALPAASPAAPSEALPDAPPATLPDAPPEAPAENSLEDAADSNGGLTDHES